MAAAAVMAKVVAARRGGCGGGGAAAVVAVASKVMVVVMCAWAVVGLGGAAAHVTKALLYQHAWSSPPSAYVLRCRWWSCTISLSASLLASAAVVHRWSVGQSFARVHPDSSSSKPRRSMWVARNVASRSWTKIRPVIAAVFKVTPRTIGIARFAGIAG